MKRYAWVLVLVLLLALWEAHVRVRGIPDYLLPAPSAARRLPRRRSSPRARWCSASPQRWPRGSAPPS
jgi:ABC-type nitrate/sulfonate/bicarbonate transport system permease component